VRFFFGSTTHAHALALYQCTRPTKNSHTSTRALARSHPPAFDFTQCILGAMVSHKPNVMIIEECLRAMSILGTHGEVRIQISKFKGIKRILSAMDRHPIAKGVQEAGCVREREGVYMWFSDSESGTREGVLYMHANCRCV